MAGKNPHFKARGWFKRKKVPQQPELEMKAREIPASPLIYSLLYQQDSYIKHCCSLGILCHQKLASKSPLPTPLLAAYSHLHNVPITDIAQVYAAAHQMDLGNPAGKNKSALWSDLPQDCHKAGGTTGVERNGQLQGR